MPPAITSHGAAIAFLHTAAVHIETFDALGALLAPELKLAHAVREDILSAAMRAGGVTPAIALDTQEALQALAAGGAAVIVCTCSTLGAIVEEAALASPVPMLRIDRPMADQAVGAGRRIGIAACLSSTIEGTQGMVMESARRAGRDCEIRTFLFSDIWPAFQEGRLHDYYEAIAERLTDAAREVDVLILAQASMAPAAEIASRHIGIPILSSPRTGFEKALELLAD